MRPYVSYVARTLGTGVSQFRLAIRNVRGRGLAIADSSLAGTRQMDALCMKEGYFEAPKESRGRLVGMPRVSNLAQDDIVSPSRLSWTFIFGHKALQEVVETLSQSLSVSPVRDRSAVQ